MRTLLLSIFVATGTAVGQTESPAPGPQFDVASVKPNTGVERGVEIGFPSPGWFHARNVWLRFLVQNAWNVKDYQVVGGPGWAASERYDIDAKTDGKASRDQMWLMLQTLLRDRFRLALHHESKEWPVYNLVAASKGGIKLQATKEGSCLQRNPEAAPAPDAPNTNVCGSSQWSARHVNGTAISIQQFTAMLANILQRPVADNTGFTGTFDVHLSWTPDQTTPGLMAPGLAPPPIPSDNAAGPTIFNVLVDQLGLKLQAAKGSVDVLVVDRAERPSGN
jgi:uncharacterized protein (TIGR03435 family)